MASAADRERRRRRSLSAGGKDGRYGSGRWPSPPQKEPAPSAPTTPKRVALRNVGRAGDKGRGAQQGPLSQGSAQFAGSQPQAGRCVGQVPNHAGGAVSRPYPDHPKNIPRSLQAPASTTRQHAGTVDLPGFASLLPEKHQARDFIPAEDWKALEESVRHYMSCIGKVKMLGAAAMAASRVRAIGGGGISSRLPLGQHYGPAGDAGASILSDPVSALQAGLAAVKFGSQLVERGWCILLDASLIPMRMSGRAPPPRVERVRGRGRFGGRPLPVPLSTLNGLGGASGAAAPSEALSSRPATNRGGPDAGGGDAADEDNVNIVEPTLKAFLHELPSEENIAKAAATADSSFALHFVWGPIHNADQGAADAKALTAGQERFTVRQSAVRASEKAAEHQCFLHKLRADMLLAAVAYEVLQMTDAERDQDNQLCASVPRTGARILATTKDAVRQVPHVDSRPSRMLRGSGKGAVPEEDDGHIDMTDPSTMRLSSYKMPQCRNCFMMAAGKD